MSDRDLIACTKRGDNDAFGELVRRYQGFVYRQAWGYLRDDEAAKDAAQDVFVTAFEGIRYLREEAALRQWLYRICRNHCLNVLRRQDLQRKCRPEPPDTQGPDVTLRVALQGVVASLDDPYREVVILRYYNDLTYDEIAEVLNISVDNVKIRLFRAKRKLKALLKGDDR